MIRNYMEEVVDTLLPSVLTENKGTCTCEKCLEDIRAIALNHLKPAYIATEKGELYKKVNELAIQFRADVFNELTKAIVIVSGNPRHM